jgi:hypothetical protein
VIGFWRLSPQGVLPCQDTPIGVMKRGWKDANIICLIKYCERIILQFEDVNLQIGLEK